MVHSFHPHIRSKPSGWLNEVLVGIGDRVPSADIEESLRLDEVGIDGQQVNA